MKKSVALGIAASALALAVPAMAAPGDPLELGEGITFDPILSLRARFEGAEQANLPDNAKALTVRARLGAEVTIAGLSLLAEGEGTAALVNDYNDTLPRNGVEPFPVVPDPETLELNRLQASFIRDGTGVTVGRQRIIHDNSRFVGNVGWRQNEQTFDAVRGQGKFGPVVLDATYSISQRTVFGAHSPNEHFDGELVLLNGGIDLAVVDAKAFAYLLDYDTRAAFSSQTYGILASAEIPVPALGKLTAMASYATQRDYGANPVAYQAPYYNAQLGAGVLGFALTAGYEELGSDDGVAAFQTPLATLHAFNGWADLFLTTPPEGLRDYYAGISRPIGVPLLSGMRAEVVHHHFQSDIGGLDYGTEWNAALTFRIGTVALLAKYANYQAQDFGVDTEKFWLQAELNF
jgi:hypothetical protein